MRVRLTTVYAGPSRTATPGTVIAVEAAEGARLVRAGFATIVDEPKVDIIDGAGEETEGQPEVAAIEPPEDQQQFHRGRRRRGR